MRLFKLLTLLTMVLFFDSCNSLPADLKEKREACTSKSNELLEREKSASSNEDYKQLITEYTKLKNDIISYTEECNRRGISKENSEKITEIDDKISKLTALASSTEETTESKIGKKITSDVYESNENGLKTYLKFEGTESDGTFGSLTLSNNASSCKYVYTYEVRASMIKVKFYASDCGANSSDQTFFFNENSNTISCYINGQRFTFKSIYNETTTNTEPQTNSNESMETVYPNEEDAKNEFVSYFNSNKPKIDLYKQADSEDKAAFGCEVLKTTLGDLNNDGLVDAIIQYQFVGNFGNASLSEIGVLINESGKLIGKILESKVKGNNPSVKSILSNGLIEIESYQYGPNDTHAGGPSILAVEQYQFSNNKLSFLKTISQENVGE